MAENHYPHVPSPGYSHLGGNDTIKQKNDYCRLPTTSNQPWSVGPSNEFGNREAYMETQLTEENYNNCGLDSNANQNDVVDDEPYPPPGLRRLVTGQTVSFDDGPSSPPFDRIIPGEGNTFNNYPQPARISKPTPDPYPDNVAISERYVSGSTTKEYNSLPHQSFVTRQTKKDGMNSYNNNSFVGPQSTKKDDLNSTGNNNSYYNADNAVNLSTQDFFDTYLHDGTSADNENALKSNQYPKKYPSMPASGFQNSENTKRDTYFQPEKPINAPKPSQNNFNDEFNNEHANSPFPVNFQSRASHLQPDKSLKSIENSQYANAEKSLDTYGSNRRASVENFTHEQPPMGSAGYDNTSYNPPKVNSSYDNSFQTYELNSSEENNAHFNQPEQLTGKGNQESFANVEDVYGNREMMKKDLAHSESNFPDHRKLGNVTKDASFGIDANKESNLKSPHRKSSTIGSDERIDHDGVSLERGKVPGAQSTPNDNQSVRQFQNASNSSYNNSHIFKTIEDEDEREEIIQGTDSDERSLGHRMVLGYNSNTIPGPSSSSRRMPLDSTVNKHYAFDSSFNRSKRVEPLERRMVVGEGGNIPSKSKNSSATRLNRGRKKQPNDRPERRLIESDDDDDDELAYETRNISPDRESRGYDRHHRNSPPLRDRRSRGRNHDSFTQSPDESYYDDDDDDRESYRHQPKYLGRRPYPKESSYRHDDYDLRYRDDYSRREERHRIRRHEEDPYYRGGRNLHSRPSSRSGSEYRPQFVDHSTSRFNKRLPFDYLDHRDIDGIELLHDDDIHYWSKMRSRYPQQYTEWFMRKFPREYFEWYNRFYGAKKNPSRSTCQDDRRGSGHSGQSSINNDISVNDHNLSDIGREQSSFKPVETEFNATYKTRSTPLKFPEIPHAKGKFDSLNQLLMINPCSPRDGQRAEVDILRVKPLEQDYDYLELLKFSGPCVVGETHVNTVSNYLRDLTNSASHSSEKLLYELIDLIIKQRGVTDGIAISELLTDSHRKSQIANSMPAIEEMKLVDNRQSSSSETELIEKFYHLFLQGNRNEALDFALNNQMWGQALIAAFTMGPKYHNRVLAEFFSIPINSPLKTAYQFCSKQTPQLAMTCSEEKWSDWRIHLAVMLSYPTSDSNFDKQAIIALGDSLSHKDIFASHFCYLAAQADFGAPTKPSTKYTLLTLRNGADCFEDYPPSRAILLTQIYEFAKRLQRREFVINSLLPYKLLLAVRLISYRNFSAASQYLESIALDIIENPNDYSPDQIRDVVELSEKIKYSDAKSLNVDSFDEKQWLIDLRRIANLNFTSETVSYAPATNDQPPPHSDVNLKYGDQQQFPRQPQSLPQPSYNQPPPSFPSNEIQQPVFFNPSSINQPMSLPPSFPPVSQQPPERRPSQPWENNFNTQDQPNSYAQQDPYTNNVNSNKNEYLEPNENNTQMNSRFDQPEVSHNDQSYWEPSPHTITMPSKSKFTYFNSEEDNKSLTQDNSHNHHKDNNQPPQPMNKNVDKGAKKEKKNENNNNNSGSSWSIPGLGIFNKLSLRSKTEMKLPDDKHPSIVWSKEKGKWVDLNEDEEDGAAEISAPPKASDLPNFQPQMGMPNQMPRPGEAPPVPSDLSADANKPPGGQSSTNMYKLSRGKGGMKTNYVNVLSQNTTPTPNVRPPGPIMDPYSNSQVPPNMKLFVPPAGGAPNSMSGDPSLNSNFSENPTMRNPNPEMPTFYNPAQYNS